MISIITPIFNCDKFIESCIQNVIDQACLDVEHIIVDGGSTDRSVEIIKRYAEKYSHIRWVSQKDKGQSDAMNKGIAMARGSIIGILNADDFYEPEVLKRIQSLFLNLPEPSLVVGNCKVLKEGDIAVRLNKPRKLNFNYILVSRSFPENPSAYFCHKSLHDKIGLYDVDEHYVMDLDFILRAVPVAQVKYVDETWGNYRFIDNTKTFNDKKNGQANRRVEELIKKYRTPLPLYQQGLIGLLTIAYGFRQSWRRSKSASLKK
ncbi:MAG: glycosyltransferase [Coleofasciculus sp. S288]|nr:glycosyltransferase [Coleofasciculus sp. S288]